MSSIRRCRNGLIAAVRMRSFIGRLLSLKKPKCSARSPVALNLDATAGPLLVPQRPHPSRVAGSFFGPIRSSGNRKSDGHKAQSLIKLAGPRTQTNHRFVGHFAPSKYFFLYSTLGSYDD